MSNDALSADGKFWLIFWIIFMTGICIITWAIMWSLTTQHKANLDAGLVPTRVVVDTLYRTEWLPKGAALPQVPAPVAPAAPEKP